MSETTGGAQEFASILVQHGKGIAHDKASALLREAVAAVKEHGKGAEVTVKLKITPVKNNPRIVQIEAKPSANIPQPEPTPAIFFADDQGGLHRNDPEQREFEYGTSTDNKSAAAGRD
jgi:hypothetical protein